MTPFKQALMLVGGAVLGTALIIGWVLLCQLLLGPIWGSITAIGVLVVALFLVTWAGLKR